MWESGLLFAPAFSTSPTWRLRRASVCSSSAGGTRKRHAARLRRDAVHANLRTVRYLYISVRPVRARRPVSFRPAKALKDDSTGDNGENRDSACFSVLSVCSCKILNEKNETTLSILVIDSHTGQFAGDTAKYEN